jgi:hypothetical protein
MSIQKCPMCLQTGLPVSSHLYPAALYNYCRNAEHVSPVMVGGGIIHCRQQA